MRRAKLSGTEAFSRTQSQGSLNATKPATKIKLQNFQNMVVVGVVVGVGVVVVVLLLLLLNCT